MNWRRGLAVVKNSWTAHVVPAAVQGLALAQANLRWVCLGMALVAVAVVAVLVLNGVLSIQWMAVVGGVSLLLLRSRSPQPKNSPLPAPDAA